MGIHLLHGKSIITGKNPYKTHHPVKNYQFIMDGTISPIGYDGMTIGSRSGFTIGYLVDI
jgi:hypothetical protein